MEVVRCSISLIECICKGLGGSNYYHYYCLVYVYFTFVAALARTVWLIIIWLYALSDRVCPGWSKSLKLDLEVLPRSVVGENRGYLVGRIGNSKFETIKI